MVPIIVEAIVLIKATIKVFFKDSNKVTLENKVLYHEKVKPSKIIFKLEELNEKIIKTKIGKNKKVKTKIKQRLSVNFRFFITYHPNHPFYHQFFDKYK